VLFRGRSWKNPLEHQRRCHRLKKQYEQKRSFKLHWTTDRTWLRYDEHEQMMYCTYGTAKNSLRTKLGLGNKNIFGLVCTDSV
jgi:hypothetical protein